MRKSLIVCLAFSSAFAFAQNAELRDVKGKVSIGDKAAAERSAVPAGSRIVTACGTARVVSSGCDVTLGESQSLDVGDGKSCSALKDGVQASLVPVAELKNVKGNVLVSNPSGMAAANDGQRVPNKVRVTTTSKAEVLIRFDQGCDVALKENQRVDIDECRPCSAILASVQPVPLDVALGAVAPGAAPAVGGTIAGVSTGATAIAVGAGVGIYLYNRDRRNVSPN
jgi:hypothetical protein